MQSAGHIRYASPPLIRREGGTLLCGSFGRFQTGLLAGRRSHCQLGAERQNDHQPPEFHGRTPFRCHTAGYSQGNHASTSTGDKPSKNKQIRNDDILSWSGTVWFWDSLDRIRDQLLLPGSQSPSRTWREGWEGSLFTLLSTPLSTPRGPEFSCCYRPSATSNAPHFSLPEASGLTAALKWSTALRGLRRACPPRAGCNGGAYKTWSSRPASPEPARHGEPARTLVFQFLISDF